MVIASATRDDAHLTRRLWGPQRGWLPGRPIDRANLGARLVIGLLWTHEGARLGRAALSVGFGHGFECLGGEWRVGGGADGADRGEGDEGAR